MINLLWLIPLGWILGGTVNYLADVLPVERSLSAPRCSTCLTASPWNSLLIPRTCPTCGAGWNARKWLVTVSLTGGTVWMWVTPPPDLGFWGGLAWVAYFALVIVIDFEHLLILHPVSIAGAVMGMGFGVYLHGWRSTLIGGVVGFGVMLLLYLAGGLFLRWITRFRGDETDEVALGFGDVTLSGVIGLLMGWPGITAGLIVAVFLLGLISGLYVLISLLRGNYQAYSALPFGPFLALSALGLLFFKELLA